MAIIGIDKDEITEYISKYDSSKDNPTVFLIGILDNDIKLKFGLDEGKKIDYKIMLEIVKSGLKGIKNLYVKKTKQYQNFDTITDEVLNLLPMKIIGELAEQIVTVNFLSATEEKN